MTGPHPSWDAHDGLASAAGELARLHALSDQRPDAISSLASLPAMSGWLSDAHAILPKEPAAAKAADWLMDNAYVVERVVRQIRGDLARGYYTRLPALAVGDESLPPRVYALAGVRAAVVGDLEETVAEDADLEANDPRCYRVPASVHDASRPV